VPRLVDLSTTAYSVKMSWKLPNYQENRCPLTEMRIITAGFDIFWLYSKPFDMIFLGVAFNRTVVKIPLQYSPLGPDVNVTIEGLSPDCVYQSLVSLWNTAGTSRNVSVSYQTVWELSNSFTNKVSLEINLVGLHSFNWILLFIDCLY